MSAEKEELRPGNKGKKKQKPGEEKTRELPITTTPKKAKAKQKAGECTLQIMDNTEGESSPVKKKAKQKKAKGARKKESESEKENAGKTSAVARSESEMFLVPSTDATLDRPGKEKKTRREGGRASSEANPERFAEALQESMTTADEESKSDALSTNASPTKRPREKDETEDSENGVAKNEATTSAEQGEIREDEASTRTNTTTKLRKKDGKEGNNNKRKKKGAVGVTDTEVEDSEEQEGITEDEGRTQTKQKTLTDTNNKRTIKIAQETKNKKKGRSTSKGKEHEGNGDVTMREESESTEDDELQKERRQSKKAEGAESDRSDTGNLRLANSENAIASAGTNVPLKKGHWGKAKNDDNRAEESKNAWPWAETKDKQKKKVESPSKTRSAVVDKQEVKKSGVGLGVPDTGKNTSNEVDGSGDEKGGREKARKRKEAADVSKELFVKRRKEQTRDSSEAVAVDWWNVNANEGETASGIHKGPGTLQETLTEESNEIVEKSTEDTKKKKKKKKRKKEKHGNEDTTPEARQGEGLLTVEEKESALEKSLVSMERNTALVGGQVIPKSKRKKGKANLSFTSSEMCEPKTAKPADSSVVGDSGYDGEASRENSFDRRMGESRDRLVSDGGRGKSMPEKNKAREGKGNRKTQQTQAGSCFKVASFCM